MFIFSHRDYITKFAVYQAFTHNVVIIITYSVINRRGERCAEKETFLTGAVNYACHTLQDYGIITILRAVYTRCPNVSIITNNIIHKIPAISTYIKHQEGRSHAGT